MHTFLNMSLFSYLESTWQKVLEEELHQAYISSLSHFIEQERRLLEPAIYPSENDVFKAFQYTSYEDIKVVILGQDPYHGKDQANGLCFSVSQGVPFPPSLRNIFKEMQDDLEVAIPNHGDLSEWAKQGVLLLNTTLTVRHGKPLSHKGKGWELFSQVVIEKLAKRENPPIFLLWGNEAQSSCNRLFHHPNVSILTAAHPSPFSAYRGFFGCRHFSKVNLLLSNQGVAPIHWAL